MAAMTLDRAREITRECMAHVMFREGIRDEEPPSLERYTLEELLEANRLVGEDNVTNPKRGQMMCAPRLVAALYVAYHYLPSDQPEAIAVAKGRAVVVVKLPKDGEGEED